MKIYTKKLLIAFKGTQVLVSFTWADKYKNAWNLILFYYQPMGPAETKKNPCATNKFNCKSLVNNPVGNIVMRKLGSEIQSSQQQKCTFAHQTQKSFSLVIKNNGLHPLSDFL